MLRSPLHTDIAVRASHRVPFSAGHTLPLEHPNLRWLSYGWGSEAFYTTAGSYADIRVSTVWQAAVGDRSVMRVVALGDLGALPSIFLSDEQHKALLASISNSFAGSREQIAGHSIGPDDAFFPATGRFHLFRTCNEWTRRVLNDAGIRTGIWTPTTLGLRFSLWLYGPGGRQP